MGYSIPKADCKMMSFEELLKAIKEFRTALNHLIDSGIEIRWVNVEYGDEWINCYKEFRFLNGGNGGK